LSGTFECGMIFMYIWPELKTKHCFEIDALFINGHICRRDSARIL